MSDVFDLQPAIDRVLNADDLVKAEGLPPGKSIFDAGQSDGLFAGIVPAGVTLSGQQSLLIEGSVAGVSGNVCRIEVAGDAIITGDVRHAVIHCRNLSIGGALHHSAVNVVGQVVVGAEVVGARLMLGDYQARKLRLEELRHKLTRLREERINLDRRISQDEKRLDRACKATRVPLNFGVSRLIFQEHNRVRVDLGVFYASLGEPSEAKLKLALNEFFAKGIIGHLAKANRKYIADNPAREKIFLQLLRHLRDVVDEVFTRDRLIVAINCAEREVNVLVDELRQSQFTASIRGWIQPDTQVEFMLPRLQWLENEEIQFFHQSARLNVHPGSKSGLLRLERFDTDGESSIEEMEAAELKEIVLRLSDNQLVWERLQRS